MKLYKRVRYPNGAREIYLFGIKVRKYYKPVILYDTDYSVLKFIGLSKCKDLQNLVIGSSHGRDGFIPGRFDFNLSDSSLDLYRIWNLYKYVVEHNGKHIKRIIIFWSVFHAGLELEKTQNFRQCILYKGLYGINYASDFRVNDKDAIEKINHDKEFLICPDNFRGKSNYDIKHDELAKDLVEKHLKNIHRNNNQIQYLEKIVNLARINKHTVYVVLPPYRSDYLKYLPNEKVVYHELFEFLNKNTDVKLLNIQHDKDFKDSDFDSPDHCNEIGGIKLTKKIKAAFRK